MSLTSYRAALPRVRAALVQRVPRGFLDAGVVRSFQRDVRFFPGLAVTYSPTS